MNTCYICDCDIIDNLNFSNLFKINKMLICSDCYKKFDKVSGGCEKCCKKGIIGLCEDCLYWKRYEHTKLLNVKNYSLYYYNNFSKDIISEVKFNGNCKILNAFYYDIKYFEKVNLFYDYFVIPVPIHSDRLNERGFNQSKYIANMFSCDILDIIKKMNNDKQSKKKRNERMNFDNNFYIVEESIVKNKKILIVDDIYTTGATIHKIASILYKCKAQNVLSFTLFRS